MRTSDRNVSLPLAIPTQRSLREAVAKIIRAIQHEHDLNDQDLADAIGVSSSTVRNARDEKADLNATTIAKVGAKYGPETIDPYHRLYGARAVPLNPGQPDALPVLANVVHLLAKAGPGVPPHPQLLAMLPRLREAGATISALIELAEKIAA